MTTKKGSFVMGRRELVTRCPLDVTAALTETYHKPSMLSAREILEYFRNLKDDFSWAFEDVTRSDTSYITHSYHRYPAKFIPQVARRLIREYTKENEIVCDPMMGSGTALVEALVLNRKAVGVDINPVADLISRAKTTPIEPSILDNIIQNLFIHLEEDMMVKNMMRELFKSKKINKKIDIQNERIDYWFPQEIKLKLARILSSVYSVKNRACRTFLLCAFSNILKNCSTWLMKSTKPTRDKNKTIPNPLAVFKKQIKMMIKKNKDFYNLVMAKKIDDKIKTKIIKKQDARNLPCKSNSVSLIVTSPPYVTSYEHADIHQLTALWLNFARNVTAFRKEFIGSVHKNGNLPEDLIKSEIAKEIIKEIKEKSNVEARGVQFYFYEMQQCFQEMFRVLKGGGKAAIVIGDTMLKKVKILNAEVFVEIMQNLGFELHKVIKRIIPSKILPQTRDLRTGRFAPSKKSDFLAYPHEYIVIMEKPKGV